MDSVQKNAQGERWIRQKLARRKLVLQSLVQVIVFFWEEAMSITERLGSFYLGKEFDLKSGQLRDVPVFYDSRDLTTHAVCVGMTGSGKTGLCIDLLEEAALDHVPMLIVDPKGDITNLLLTFPNLLPQDFLPWIDPNDARRKDMTLEAYAIHQAETWAKGLAHWDQGPERIRLLKNSADFVIYTPGSDAGIPVNILSSFEAPNLHWDEEQEALRERINGTVSAILGLIGLQADPLQSREHILLTTLFEHFWRKGEFLDLPRLIHAIQKPPVLQLGVFDVDTFFPAKSRFELAMALNNILAAPSFETWIKGVPLNIDHMLYGGDAKPNVSIFYIAHLSDAERMFFVTLLLEQLITWMRSQGGTTSLRALFYMDEVFGYFPPIGNPASKIPMLTLLKQARAFGLGLMLTTQNPGDLDYKGLNNAGTWFVGRLQAERDKQRLLDGLEGFSNEAAVHLSRRELDRIISGLGNRVFLLHNVHQKQPVLFQTRWAMSYLCGPMTRNQVRDLVKLQIREGTGPQQPETPEPSFETKSAVPHTLTGSILPPDVPQLYLPVMRGLELALEERETGQEEELEVKDSLLRYDAFLLGMGTVHFIDDKRTVREREDIALWVPPPQGASAVDWAQARDLNMDPRVLDSQPVGGALFGEVPGSINSSRKLTAMRKGLSEYLYRNKAYTLFYNPALKVYSEPGEDKRTFKIRLQQRLHEERDKLMDKLQDKYESKLATLHEKMGKERNRLSKDQSTYNTRKQQEWLSAGEALLRMFGGRKRIAPTLSSASQKRQMTERAKKSLEQSQRTVEQLSREIEDVRSELNEISRKTMAQWDQTQQEIEEVGVRPRRTDVQVREVAVAWTPAWQVVFTDPAGQVRTESLSAV